MCVCDLMVQCVELFNKKNNNNLLVASSAMDFEYNIRRHVLLVYNPMIIVV